MASITDCVAEGLKYPLSNPKKLLGLGVLFAVLSALSTYISILSFNVLMASVNVVENTNSTLSQIPFSQLPAGDFYLACGLTLISFIVALFILGYQYDVIKFSIDRKSDFPGFDDIPGLFLKGIKCFIAVIAYNIIPMIVLVGGIALVGDSSLLAVILLVSGLLYIIANFLLIMALSNMAAHDSLKKAFDFAEITQNISNLGWGKYVGTVLFTLIVIMIISVAVSFIMSIITVALAMTISNQALIVSIILAVIEGLFVDSYMTVFFSRVCGSIYRESVK